MNTGKRRIGRTLMTLCAVWLSGVPVAADLGERAWPDEYPVFDYCRQELHERWSELHARDRVPFPDVEWIMTFSAEPPDDPEALALALLDGWRRFHAGDFAGAYAAGNAAGRFLAGRAWLAYTLHMIPDIETRRTMLEAGIRMVEAGLKDRNPPPAYWEIAGLGLFYGEYGRTLPTNRAQAEGIPGTVRRLLEKTLSVEPDQPVALGTLGAWNAELIDRVGRLLARALFDARRDEIAVNFERALAIGPDIVQTHVEYAEALLLVYGRAAEAKALDHLRSAVAISPKDAEDYLQRLRAKRIRDSWILHGRLPREAGE